VQAARNRGAAPAMEHIEAALQAEMEDYWTRLREGAASVEAAQCRLGALMTPEEGREFRQIYYKVELAIMILDKHGHHLGYIPRVKNEALARLMDAGKLLFGRMESKEWVGHWLRLETRIFLRDL